MTADIVVPAADLVAAAIVAWLLYRLGLRLGPPGTALPPLCCFSCCRILRLREWLSALRSQCDIHCACGQRRHHAAGAATRQPPGA
jgi:hypothetical protein